MAQNNQSRGKSEKHLQVDKDKTTVFALVAIAAVSAVFALALIRGFWSRAGYLGKVADTKKTALTQLESNKAAVDELKKAYDDFNGQAVNLVGASSGGDGPLEGDNASLVLDALPSKYDFPALTSSMERILGGFRIEGITGVDDSLAQQSASLSGAVEIPLSVDLLVSYDGFKDLLSRLDRSIRPFQLVNLELKGTNSELKTLINLKTYYQPQTGLQITTEEVP